jgi:UDP-3-O-[3-hydroxymyristoyl] glucosamine N-acyltransferase
MKLGTIGEKLSCRVVGLKEIEISGVAPIEAAAKGELTFLSNIKYRRYLATTQASAIITDDEANLLEGQSGIISPNPYLTFAEALALFHSPPEYQRGIHSHAMVSPSAIIGENVTIGPFSLVADRVKIGDHVTLLSHCVIYPDAEIGDQTIIHSHCVIRERCRIGARVILQNGVVIGSDGFGYAKRADKSWYKILQTGFVILEDDVEVGAGSVVDRASIGTTIIGRGTKIDNLVQIGHGSTVGKNTLLCAQVGLAGSTQVGNEVILSGQVGAAGHLTIGDRVIATAQTGIPNSVDPDQVISGYPAIANRDWLRSSAVFARLPQLQKEIRELQKKVAQLESLLDQDSRRS